MADEEQKPPETTTSQTTTTGTITNTSSVPLSQVKTRIDKLEQTMRSNSMSGGTSQQELEKNIKQRNALIYEFLLQAKTINSMLGTTDYIAARKEAERLIGLSKQFPGSPMLSGQVSGTMQNIMSRPATSEFNAGKSGHGVFGSRMPSGMGPHSGGTGSYPNRTVRQGSRTPTGDYTGADAGEDFFAGKPYSYYGSGEHPFGSGQVSSGTYTGSNNRNEIIKAIVDEWRKAGMSDAGIAGILANIEHESGFKPGMLEQHPTGAAKRLGGGHGLYQFTGEEWTRYRNWLEKNYPKSNWEDPRLQTRFVAENIKSGNNVNPDLWERMKSGSKEEAAKAFVSGYERPRADLRRRREVQYNSGIPDIEHYIGKETQTGGGEFGGGGATTSWSGPEVPKDATRVATGVGVIGGKRTWTEQQLAGREKHAQGIVRVSGPGIETQEFHGGSGGSGYGTPPGTFTLSRQPTGSRIAGYYQKLGIPIKGEYGISYNVGTAQYGSITTGHDPAAGRSRSQIQIHSTGDFDKLTSEGCLAIPKSEFPKFVRTVEAARAKWGGALLETDYNKEKGWTYTIRPPWDSKGEKISTQQAVENQKKYGAPTPTTGQSQGTEPLPQKGGTTTYFGPGAEPKQPQITTTTAAPVTTPEKPAIQPAPQQQTSGDTTKSASQRTQSEGVTSTSPRVHIPGKSLAKVDPVLSNRIQTMYAAAPSSAKKGFQIISSVRDTKLQTVLYKRYLSDLAHHVKHPRIAAKPGFSQHERGRALDVRDPSGWFHKHASEYGLGFPVKGDYPHMQAIPEWKGTLPTPVTGKELPEKFKPHAEPTIKHRPLRHDTKTHQIRHAAVKHSAKKPAQVQHHHHPQQHSGTKKHEVPSTHNHISEHKHNWSRAHHSQAGVSSAVHSSLHTPRERQHASLGADIGTA